jgi:hypothetical protein
VNGNKLGKDMLSKMKTSVVVAALLLAVSAHAKDTSVAAPVKINVEAIQASLSELPAVEIPVKASKMMEAASKEAKLATAKAILESVLKQRPQMAIQLVASLVKASPETASQVATLGASVVPQYATQIIKVAAASAPAYAKDIALASCMAYPSQTENIVSLVSSVVPAARAEIVSSVSRQSELLRFISAALAQSGGQGGTGSIKTSTSSISQLRTAEGVKQLERGIASTYPTGWIVTVSFINGVLTIIEEDPDGGKETTTITESDFPDPNNIVIISGGEPGQAPDRPSVYNL